MVFFTLSLLTSLHVDVKCWHSVENWCSGNHWQLHYRELFKVVVYIKTQVLRGKGSISSIDRKIDSIFSFMSRFSSIHVHYCACLLILKYPAKTQKLGTMQIQIACLKRHVQLYNLFCKWHFSMAMLYTHEYDKPSVRVSNAEGS